MDDRHERKAALDSLNEHYGEIVTACKDTAELMDTFQEVCVIDEEEREKADHTGDYTEVIKTLQEKISIDPNLFVKFVHHIQSKDDLRCLGEALLETYSNVTVGGQSLTDSNGETLPKQKLREPSISHRGDKAGSGHVKPKIQSELKKLRDQILVLQGIHSESDDTKAGKLMMIETAVNSFITTCLDMGVDVQDVHVVLENLHTKDVDVHLDGELFQRCVEELERQNKIRNPDSPSLEHSLLSQPLNEVNFGMEVMQNSLVACHLLNNAESQAEHLAYPHSLSELTISDFLYLGKEDMLSSQSTDDLESFTTSSTEMKAEGGSLVEVNSHDSSPAEVKRAKQKQSKIEGPVHRYLVAKGTSKPGNHVIYYLAFGSHQTLREWKTYHTSFEDGFKRQRKQLPIQFILERLWEGASIVLTGFSFGGILAHLCATHLWSLSQGICPELLEKNLLCITFGQPVLSLPSMTDFTKRVADKTRFHAIFIPDDIIPRMMRFLDSGYTNLADRDLSDRFRSDHPNELFHNHLSTSLMKQLMTLQESAGSERHTNMRRMVHNIERSIYRKIDEKLEGHKTTEKVFNHLTGRKHQISDESSSAFDAMQDLRDILRPLKRQRFNVIPSYVTYSKMGSTSLLECSNSDFEYPVEEEIQEDLFSKHSTEVYIQKIQRSCTRKHKFDEPEILETGTFVIPTIKRLEIHHLSHHNTAALSLDGDNLCFTFRFNLYLHKSDSRCTVDVDQKQSVSSRSIQIHEVPLAAPRDFDSSTESSASEDYQETEDVADISLHTHFGVFTFEKVEVKHKKFFISCRKQQVANLSIAEVIELSFLGALLEKHPRSSSHTNRYKVIKKFLESIVEVVPIESLFSCIAFMDTDQKARHLCNMLKKTGARPPLSLSFFINAALAITKLRGGAVQFNESATLEDLFHVFAVAARRRSQPLFSFWQSSHDSPDESRYLKWFGPDVASGCRNPDMVKHLQMIVGEAIGESTGRIPAISGISVKKFLEDSEKMNSPDGLTNLPKIMPLIKLLSMGRRDVEFLQKKARNKLKTHGSTGDRDIEMSYTKAHNTILLDYVKKLRSEELHMCICIITAFMEEQVRIPISDFNLTVSYWQLLKLGLGIFHRKVSKDVVTQYISVSKHIRSIADETGHAVDEYETNNAVNSKYAGKLQFLLRASLRQDEPLLIDEKFQMYSLESRLFWRFAHPSLPEHQRIDDLTPLRKVEENWDTLFKDVGLSKVVHSHRRLIARWLKFSLMIHKLRSELSSNTTIGIVGLVNSGKSTLVKELFNIEAVETGTREEKRTTVPFLYHIPGVDNFDVIDFPGVDDQDDSIADLVNLLRTLSQMVVFVVNYRNAHTQAAVEWYKKLNQYAIPHLVCLTHGDRLYAECADDEQCQRDPAHAKKAIKKQVEIVREQITSKASDSPIRCLELFSLKVDNDSLLKSQEGQRNIREAGIKGVKDAGRWIVKTLEDHLKETATAQLLNTYLSTI